MPQFSLITAHRTRFGSSADKFPPKRENALRMAQFQLRANIGKGYLAGVWPITDGSKPKPPGSNAITTKEKARTEAPILAKIPPINEKARRRAILAGEPDYLRHCGA